MPIEELLAKVRRAVNSATTPHKLENIRVDYLGRKGKINRILKKVPSLPEEERQAEGRRINKAKQEIEKMLAEKLSEIKTPTEKELAGEWMDLTEPGDRLSLGHLHPVTRAIQEIIDIFRPLGFEPTSYREVETDWYAFGSLNMGPDHPARDEWETFFLKDDYLLTPHTSSGQVRELERWAEPPVRMINVSKCYRRQSDASHVMVHHQFEGLAVDTDISIPNLKGVLSHFMHRYFGSERQVRIRPYDFRFTEPSFEVDVSCGVCAGEGCRVCKEGWLEIGGAGMVHPQVLANGGVDPDKYTGLAFGWGVERVLLMKEGIDIPDLRLLYSNDIDFLTQF